MAYGKHSVWQHTCRKLSVSHTCASIASARIQAERLAADHIRVRAYRLAACRGIAYASIQALARSSCSASKLVLQWLLHGVARLRARACRQLGPTCRKSLSDTQEGVGRHGRRCRVGVARTATPTATAATVSRTLKGACACHEAQGLSLCLSLS